MHESQISFLKRWSERKAAARAAANPQERRPLQPAMCEAEAERGDASSPPPTEADIARLNASSDYARFLAGDVAPALRVAALRKLWACDAGLSAPDGLIDYAGDYSAAPAHASVALQTAYRIGAGFLTEEESEAWASLGRPSEDQQG